MVKSCAVWGCTARYRAGTGLGFYSFPSEKTEDGSRQKQAWIARMKRVTTNHGMGKKLKTKSVHSVVSGNLRQTAAWQPGRWDVVCGRHFVTRKPNPDAAHPDYAPSLHMQPASVDQDVAAARLARYNRQQKRHSTSDMDNHKGNHKVTASSAVEEQEEQVVPMASMPDLQAHPVPCSRCSSLMLEVECLQRECDSMKKKLEQREINEGNIKFYTGVPTMAAFMWVFSLVSTFITERVTITKKDQILLSLMKLRLGLQNKDLGYRFGISPSTVSKIINECIPTMAQRLKFLIQWPSKEILLHNMPEVFKKKFKNCRVIIDCTEFFIDRPFNIRTRAQTWSNYKHHHTLKALIGITPYGSISFISKLWGGRISDKDITARCGFYDKLERGDQVMADRGFTISQELAMRGAYLVMPPFIAGRKQLPGGVVQKARQISRLRIHVERSIERVKNFAITKNTLPLTLVPLADDILTVCSCLSNLQPKLIK